MSYWGCAFLAVFCAYAISSGDAIRCFVCRSDQDYACGDPFYSHLPLIDCDNANRGYQPQSQAYLGSRSVCKKTKSRSNGYEIVERSCALDENYGSHPCGTSQSQNQYGYRDNNYQSSYTNSYGYGPSHCSICRYDGCNSATGIVPTVWALATSTAAMAAVKFL